MLDTLREHWLTAERLRAAALSKHISDFCRMGKGKS
jgi:hypothetical protein